MFNTFFTRFLRSSLLMGVAMSVLAAPLSDADHSTISKSVVSNSQKTYEANMKRILGRNSSGKCNINNVAIRRAWDDLSIDERKDYIEAVKCVTKKPARTSKELAPGVRNWLDDFVYAHINQTNFIHVSGLLLPWHRQFVWSWEQTLRNECGYKGYLPYWTWERHSDDQTKSPVFQPDEASFGTNGAYIPHNATLAPTIGLPDAAPVYREPGTGGGYISDGAFKDLELHLGPVSPSNATINTPDNIYGTKYNPRPLSRDFSQEISTANLTYQTISDLWQTTSIHDFHLLLESKAHIYSHLYIGGDGSDTYQSPNEPVFFLIHAQIDRLWTVWQGFDYEARRDGLDGTVTIADIPPSENATLSSIMKMGVAAGGDLPIGYAMSTIEKDYCYMYDH